MQYKIQTLEVDSRGNVDIPKGWIPLGYRETLDMSTGGASRMVGKLTVLEPMEVEED